MKRILALILCILMEVTLMTACSNPTRETEAEVASETETETEAIVRREDRADTSAYRNTTYILAGVDDLGRRIDPVNGGDADKQVGIFYFLWLGASSSEGPFDVSKVLEKDPDAGRSSAAWTAAGGGDVGQRHWWGESLFGYYRSHDP